MAPIFSFIEEILIDNVLECQMDTLVARNFDAFMTADNVMEEADTTECFKYVFISPREN